MGYEAACPLCKTPRAKGQMRCICNYTFEYERESRPFRRVSTSNWTTSRIVLVVAGIAVLAVGASIALWAA